MTENSQDAPRFQRLGPANWLPEERKSVERYERRIRELELKLATQQARTDNALYKLKANRPFRVVQALRVAAKSNEYTRLPRDLGKAIKGGNRPKAPLRVTEVIAHEKERGPVVDIPSVQWPDGPVARPDMRVAVILDDFSRMAFRYEWDQIEFGKDDWREVFAEKRPEMLFCESAWHGNQTRWRYQMTGTNAPKQELRDLIAWCKQEGIPTVFWNKEDPPNFDFFIDTAKLFDYVYTCDGDMVPKYREILGHDRVGVLQFAAQPRIHNPIQNREGRPYDIVFGGMYFRDKHPERREQMETILAPVRKLGLHIFARNGTVDDKYAWPEEYRPHIVGELPYEQMLAAYKMYKVFLNVNSVIDSPTMCARRVFELSACSTTVLSGWSRAIEKTFGSLVPVAQSEEEAYNLALYFINSPELRARQGHLAMREVFDKHLFSHRVDQILTDVGRPVTSRSRSVSIVLPTNRPGQIEHAISQVARQKHRNLELILVLHGLSEDTNVIRDKALAAGVPAVKVLNADASLTLGEVLNHGIAHAEGELISKMDDDNLYGEHYLSDLLRAFDYSDAELVGKGGHYTYFAHQDVTVYRLPGLEHRYTHLVQGGTITAKADLIRSMLFEPVNTGEDTRLVRRCQEENIPIYSADRFNFVYMRNSDAAAHTWQAADHVLTRNAQFAFAGHPEAHVMI
ncbi:glycosyltransferase family protein [Planotetraspora kaengkrachanensis]|uniref:Glycosyl transferase n=1 Tax=Planotetraspora kaengkrachanensis TaxID=575193 RepID=A0A8J3M772_9ACTN|nr:glycosyltransferase [Planotetraspora kaengkrachanensis]GIG80814.1 glycosyl transferase [Planotetraspora kaengkrachanensis]